jgi:Mn-containing catalase
MKHTDPNMCGDPMYLEYNDDTKTYNAPVGGTFFPYSKEGGEPKYLTWDGKLEAAEKQLDRLIEMLFYVSETSPACFGLDKNATTESGAALKKRLLRTLAKVNRKKLYSDPAIKDLFLDIAAEELSHMEMVATTVNLLNGHNLDAPNANIGSIEAHVLTGLNPGLTNASGYPWNGAYLDVTGDLAADILSNIAGEQRAKVVYEYLHRQINNKGVRDTIDFLLNREEAHNTLFRMAFNMLEETGSLSDWGVTPDSKQYFDLSTPGKFFDANNLTNPKPPKFNIPNQPKPQ